MNEQTTELAAIVEYWDKEKARINAAKLATAFVEPPDVAICRHLLKLSQRLDAIEKDKSPK